MKHIEIKSTVVGVSGIIGTLSVETISAFLSVTIGILTVLTLIPAVIKAWRAFLFKRAASDSSDEN